MCSAISRWCCSSLSICFWAYSITLSLLFISLSFSIVMFALSNLASLLIVGLLENYFLLSGDVPQRDLIILWVSEESNLPGQSMQNLLGKVKADRVVQAVKNLDTSGILRYELVEQLATQWSVAQLLLKAQHFAIELACGGWNHWTLAQHDINYAEVNQSTG